MKIGLLSDTHNFLDEKIFKYFKECDEIWHAGDIGSIEIADQLSDFKVLRAVYGNIDEPSLHHRYSEELVFDIEGLKVPHPRFDERDFVLRPLLDLDPTLCHPKTKEPLETIYRRLERRTILHQVKAEGSAHLTFENVSLL